MHSPRWNKSEDTQEMPQSRSTVLPRPQKKERWRTNTYTTNATYEISGNKRRRTAKDDIFNRIFFFFLFLVEDICCGYSLEAPRRGASNKYSQHIFSWRNKKTVKGIPLSFEAMIKVLFLTLRKHAYFKYIENFTTRKRLIDCVGV